jgi:hypothetical protein
MSSTPGPTQIDPHDIPTLAPDAVVTGAVAKSEPHGKSSPAAPQKAVGVVASAKVPPVVDTTFRPASGSNVKGAVPRLSLGSRLLRGVIGMILTATLAGAAVLWQSRGEAARQIVASWAPPFVQAWLSPQESQAVDQQSAAPAVETTAVAAEPPPSAPQSPVDNVAPEAASPISDSAQLLQSMARDLANLRQEMEQMKAGIAGLKAGQDQMAREVAKASDQNPRPRVSLVSPPPAQPVVLPARKPPPIARPLQPGAASAPPQAAASYMPRRVAVPPPPQSAAAPPTDLSAPRPPAPLREQMP